MLGLGSKTTPSFPTRLNPSLPCNTHTHTGLAVPLLPKRRNSIDHRLTSLGPLASPQGSAATFLWNLSLYIYYLCCSRSTFTLGSCSATELSQLWKILLHLQSCRSDQAAALPTESESHSAMSESVTPWTVYQSGFHALLQGIEPTQGLNPGLPHCRQILYQLSHKESPRILEWVAYPSADLPDSNWTGVSCIAGRFFTNSYQRSPFPQKKSSMNGVQGCSSLAPASGTLQPHLMTSVSSEVWHPQGS